MLKQRLVIAGVSSGVGKTTITLGLMAALKQRGLNVQGFKCGPDYIDTSFHTAVTERPSRNIDSWMFSKNVMKEIFVNGSNRADISIIEGVMGLYDGRTATSNEGTTAEISILLDSPIVLVIDCSLMARSAAAIVKGYQLLDDRVKIVGVIANKVGSIGHYQIIKDAVEQECAIPVCGYLLNDSKVTMPERHLGLVPLTESRNVKRLFSKLAKLVEETINVEQIIELSKSKPLAVDVSDSIFIKQPSNGLKIAIAKDQAFNFYYQENIDLIEAYGAECLYFSPLRGEEIPKEADGLYIGGGFPEQFAEELSKRVAVNHSIKQRIEDGLPTIAECGGFMYLAESIETKAENHYQMVGVIPGSIKMENSLQGFGYREITGQSGNYLFSNDQTARGHEFHYSSFNPKEPTMSAYHTIGVFGECVEGVITNNVIAGYTHIHFASCPKLVENFFNKCLEMKNNE